MQGRNSGRPGMVDAYASSLLSDQKTSDRPDLIVRVFRMKLWELLSDILKKHVFGRPLAHVYTIESHVFFIMHTFW